MTKNPVCGGQPISPEQAHGLRRVVFGNASVPTRSEWLTTGFAFRDPDVEFAYGLRVPSAARPSTRALLMAVQAYVVRHLLFERYLSQSPPRSSNTDEPDTSVLRPSRITQTDALHSTLSTILWRIADKGKAWVCLPQDTAYVHQSQEYFQDGVTEKLHLFEFSDLETLQIFIKRYIYVFQEDPGPGSLLFLYSAVLTRGISKSMTKPLSQTRLFPQSRPQFGVLTRSDVGLLVHDDNSENQIPGSRLKTPSVPVWVTYASGHYGVLFNTNKDLLRDYHAERRYVYNTLQEYPRVF
ncbi:hypothetical protein B566_EDAN005256 [Ephemera danica]|nr:hypothetical protein B566_EDAN005256 [Ephemera danica]